MKKRLFCLLLCAAMLLSLFPAALAEDITVVDVEDEDLIPLVDTDKENLFASGACGGVSWSFDGSTLTITGDKEMADFDEGDNTPTWIGYKNMIETVIVKNGVKSIGAYAFYDYPGLKKVVLADSVKTISRAAFWGCQGMDSLELGNGVEEIGAQAFCYCEKLGSVRFPDGLRTISSYAFAYSNLSTLVLPDTVNTIGYGAFCSCKSLSNAVIGAGVSSIDSIAFSGTGLKDLYFMGSAPSFGDDCFKNVTAAVHYPSGKWNASQRLDYGGTLTWKGFDISGDCGELLSWRLEGSGLLISSEGDDGDDCTMWDFSTTSRPGWYDAAYGIQKLRVGSGVQSIGDYAFSAFLNLREAELVGPEEGGFTIGAYAFNGCLSLSELTLPAKTRSIGDYAFSLCTLSSIQLNSGLQKIGQGAFVFTLLERIEIPASVTEIGATAFGYNASLTRIYLRCKPSALSADCFSNVTATAYYPSDDPAWTASARQNYGGTLTWEALAAAPVLSVKGMNTDGIKLSWTESPGAGKYHVFIDMGRWYEGDNVQVIDAWVTGTELLYGPDFLKTWGYVLWMNDRLEFRVEPDNGAGPSNTVAVTYEPFSDVSGTKTLEYVGWAFNHGIVNGTAKTKFSPDNPCSRIQFIMMLWKMNGSPDVGGKNPFSDISGTKTTKAILWALKAGVINSGRKFYPDDPISRVQIVMILWKMAGSPAVSGKCPFTDVSGTKTTQAVLWAYKKGITKGTDATHFSPDKDCTRVQLVVFLYKYNNIYHIVPDVTW